MKRILASTLFLLASSSLAQANDDCLQVIEQSCTGCHSSQRICDKIGDYEKGHWWSCVTKMSSYSGQLGSDKQKKVLDCLETLAKESVTVCQQHLPAQQ